jgi:hypothetical protein
LIAALRVTIVPPRIAWAWRTARGRFLTGSLLAHVFATIGFVWLPTLWRGPSSVSGVQTRLKSSSTKRFACGSAGSHLS